MENYTVVKTVGKGSFGTADLVQDRRDKNMYILKKTRLARQPELQREASIQEMFIQKGITHRNIVRCKESWIDKAFVVCLVLEYCSLGELSHALQNRKQTDYFPEDAILEMFVQLVSSLDYLHKSSIVHRDIKAGNVFVRQDCSLALGDFGLSQVEGTSPELSHTMLGTPQYMAPEIVSGTPMYTCKTDVWALGVLFYEITTLKTPFSAFNMEGLVLKIKQAPVPQIAGDFSPEWKTILRSCLLKNPSQRPSCAELLDDPHLQDALRRVNHRFGPPVTGQHVPVAIPLKEVQDLMDRCKKRSNPTPPPAQPRDASARAAVGIQQGARKTPPPSSGADRSQAQRLPPAQPHPQPQEPRGRTTTPSLPPTTPPAQQGTASGPRPPAVPTEAAAPELPRVQAQNHRLELPAPRKGSEALKLHPPRQPVPQAGKKPRENVRSPWGKLSKGEKKQEVPPAPGLRKPAVQRLSWVPSSPSGTKSNDPEASAPRRRSGSTAHPPSSEVPSSSVDSPAQRAGVKEGPAEAGGTTKGPAATGTSRGRSGRPVSTSAKRPAVPPGGGATELSRFAADSRGRPPALPFSEARGTAHAAAKMTLPSSRSQGDPGKSTTEDEEHEGPGRASDIVRPRASHAMGHRSPGTSGAMGQQGARLHGMRERASASPGFSEFSRASLSRGGGGARVAVSSGRRRPADPPGGNGWPAEAKKTGSAPQGQRVALRGAEEGKRPGVEFPSPRSSGETVATPGQAAAGGKRGPQPRQAPRSSQAPPSPGNSSKRPSTSAGKHQLPATNRRSTVLAGPLRSQGVAEGLPGNTRPGLALEVSGGAYLGSSPAPKTPSQKPTTLFQRQLEELFSKPPRSKCLSDDSGVVPSPEAPDQKAPRTKGLAPTASQATVLCPASPLLRSLQPSSSSKRRQIARKADWHLLGGSMDPYGVLARGTSRQSERGRTRGLGSASESLRRQLQKIADSYDAAGRADAPGHRPNISLSRTHTLSQYAAVPAGL